MKTLLAVLLLAAPLAEAAQPVVVELFTSQGCSSCPPADALIRELRKQPNVIPIAYHVDYWNHLGWHDPFSSHDWTLRQMQYVSAFNLSGAYTPQMVVAGSREMVGSNGRAIQAAIDEASQHGSIASVKLSVDRGEALVETNVPRAGLELIVVTTEDGVVTTIERGENRGVTQTSDAIARKLVRVEGIGAGKSTHRIAAGAEHGKVIAMLQDPLSLKIVAAAVAGH
jgi:hypothetical protein